MADPRATSLPFREAAEFWRRKVNVPTATWRDLQRGDHAHGFMVAGAARLDVLTALRDAVDRVQDGASIEDFRRDFDAIVARTGWQYNGGRNWRTAIIYQTNLRSAYQAGRWQQMQAIKHRRPYWQYVHNDSVKHPRPEHLGWNGKVLNADDPWWSTHFPPNGYGCQCTVRTLAERDMQRLGLTMDEAPTPVDNTDGLDPGFDYNIGEAASSLPAAVRFGQKVMALPAGWRDIALADAQTRAGDLYADWGWLVDRVAGRMAAARETRQAVARGEPAPLFQPNHERRAQPLGMLRPKTLQSLAAGRGLDGRTFAPVSVESAQLIAEDAQLIHALRDTHAEHLGAITAALRQAPQVIADGAASVLWDREDAALIYAWALPDGHWAKLVVRVGWHAQHHHPLRRPDRLRANMLRTVWVVSLEDLRAARYALLEGMLE